MKVLRQPETKRRLYAGTDEVWRVRRVWGVRRMRGAGCVQCGRHDLRAGGTIFEPVSGQEVPCRKRNPKTSTAPSMPIFNVTRWKTSANFSQRPTPAKSAIAIPTGTEPWERRIEPAAISTKRQT